MVPRPVPRWRCLLILDAGIYRLRCDYLFSFENGNADGNVFLLSVKQCINSRRGSARLLFVLIAVDAS